MGSDVAQCGLMLLSLFGVWWWLSEVVLCCVVRCLRLLSTGCK